MAFAKLQQGTDNKQLSNGGGMTGNATGGANQGSTSTAATPGQFTNIQDYMGANKGDKTNQNYLNNAADKQIGAAKEQMNNNVAQASTGANAINNLPTASYEGVTNLMNNNDYTNAQTYANYQAPTYNAPTIANPTANLDGNLSSVMSYMGGVKPQGQNYSQGAAKFDEMLLGGDPQFSKDFAQNKKDQFQNEVADPYGAFKATRAKQESDANANTTEWQNQMKEYMKAQEKAKTEGIKTYKGKQQDDIDYEDSQRAYVSDDYNYSDMNDWITQMRAANNGALPPEDYVDTQTTMNPTNPYYAGYAPTDATGENEWYTNNNGADTYADYNALVAALGGNTTSANWVTPNEVFNYGDTTWNPSTVDRRYAGQNTYDSIKRLQNAVNGL